MEDCFGTHKDMMLTSLHLRLCYSLLLLSSFPKAMSLNAAVTGANRGLGLEICRQLCDDVNIHQIFAICRKTSSMLTELSRAQGKIVVVEDVNVSQDECVSKMHSVFSTLSESPIPIGLLIHNAGLYGPAEPFQNAKEMHASQTLQNITMDRMRGSFEVNTLGPLRVTQALLPNLRASFRAKVIIISSLMGSLTDNTSGGHYGYRMAKAGVNMIGKSLSEDLRGDDIAVGMIHPGFVLTGFGSSDGATATEPMPGQRDVEPAVKGVLQAVETVTIENTGIFLHGNYGDGVKSINW
jgi:NAD(P)-dependent dehydrogenase (short-subunit alcohol dehydrogenase family)